VASVPAVLRLSLPRQALAGSCALILQGQELDREALARDLVRSGYLNVPLVEDPGTFAFRGGILDIHSPLLPDPVRIELLGNQVESLRTFDPATQRTLQRLESVYLGPVREILQDEAATDRALSEIDRLAGELDLSSGRWLAHRRALREGVRFFGIEALLPAFHPRLESLLDYLPGSTLVLLDDPGAVRAEADACLQRAQAAHAQAVASGKLAFPPQQLDLSPAAFHEALRRHPQLVLGLCDEPIPVHELPTQDVAGLRRGCRRAPRPTPRRLR
jgi:transcription-repair coupling factor (superfamily II helicase)